MQSIELILFCQVITSQSIAKLNNLLDEDISIHSQLETILWVRDVSFNIKLRAAWQVKQEGSSFPSHHINLGEQNNWSSESVKTYLSNKYFAML